MKDDSRAPAHVREDTSTRQQSKCLYYGTRSHDNGAKLRGVAKEVKELMFDTDVNCEFTRM
jgi:hypothetical protein